jgi:putative CocE/NonD family hydrolase
MTLYAIKVEIDRRIQMRDGTALSVHITRPEPEGRYPTVMSYCPYRYLPELAQAPSDREYSNSFNSSHYLAERGYVCVNYDVRGTGASGGASTDMYSDAERQDGYDMVEWIASQPWSNGHVGIWGISYGAVVAWQIAAAAPPHLRAIIVRSGTDDVYGDFNYPGGMLRSFWMFGSYVPMMTALNFAPPAASWAMDDWEEIWAGHLRANAPWSIGFLEHQTDDEYWAARSVRPDYDRIKCAVFVIEGWADWYPTAVLRAFANLKVPKRALIGPWGHDWPENAFLGPRIDARPEYLKWFDEFLKRADTGVLNEPPVTIFVKKYQPPAPTYNEELGFWRQEAEWPPARSQETPMFLASAGLLKRELDPGEPLQRDHYVYRPSVGIASGILAQGFAKPWGMPLDQRSDEAYSLTYTTVPLEEDLEATGNPTAHLFVSSSADVAYFHVRVCDVAPDGVSKLLTDGGLNATRRNSRHHPEQLKRNEVYELEIELKSMAYIFPRGHRIRVSISSSDFQNIWPASRSATNTVLRGMECPSRIVLPLINSQCPDLTAPTLLGSPSSPKMGAPPGYALTWDLTNQTLRLSTEVHPLNSINRATYRLSDNDPADVEIEGVSDYKVSRPQCDVNVRARLVTTSDAQEFRHSVEVEITVNGKPYFNKTWMNSVARVMS